MILIRVYSKHCIWWTSIFNVKWALTALLKIVVSLMQNWITEKQLIYISFYCRLLWIWCWKQSTNLSIIHFFYLSGYSVDTQISIHPSMYVFIVHLFTFSGTVFICVCFPFFALSRFIHMFVLILCFPTCRFPSSVSLVPCYLVLSYIVFTFFLVEKHR